MKPPLEIVKGRITGYDERTGELLIRAPYPDWETMIKREFKSCLVQPIDSRPLSDKQRRACYALIGEIADYTGEGKDPTKERMKLKFLMEDTQAMGETLFSLSNAPMSLVCGFQRFLVRFILDWNIPTRFPLLDMRNGYQKGLTIDRIDNDVGYNPSNCRWVTRDIQNRNTSRTHRIDCGNNRFLTAAEVGRIVDVDRCTIARWCREYSATTIEEIETICEKRIHRKRKTNWALLGKKEDIPSW